MAKPIFVYVNWSELNSLKEKSLHRFESFEMKCAVATHDMQGRSGYYKTSIKVLFDDGSEYSCRVDLDPQCRGFKDHAKSVIAYRHSREAAGVPYADAACADFLEAVTF